jgi:hypothetical protein
MEIIMTEVHPGIAALAEYDAEKAQLLFSIRCGHRERHKVGTMHATSGGFLLRANDLRVVDLPMTHRDSHHYLYWPHDQRHPAVLRSPQGAATSLVDIDDVGDQSVALHCARCSDRNHNTWWRYLVRDLFAVARTPDVDYVFPDVAALIPVASGGVVCALRRVFHHNSR